MIFRKAFDEPARLCSCCGRLLTLTRPQRGRRIVRTGLWSCTSCDRWPAAAAQWAA